MPNNSRQTSVAQAQCSHTNHSEQKDKMVYCIQVYVPKGERAPVFFAEADLPVGVRSSLCFMSECRNPVVKIWLYVFAL